MNKKFYILSLKNKVLKAYSYFEASELTYQNSSNSFTIEVTLFFNEMENFELKEIFEKVDEKYGWYLRYYEKVTFEKQMDLIKTILVFFTVLSIASIVIGGILFYNLFDVLNGIRY